MSPFRSRLRRFRRLRALHLYWRAVRSPRTRPTLRLVREHGLTVQAGPFAGLRYPRGSVLRVPPLAARLIGSYERELHPAVEALVAREPELVVNIGAADGYYAVGMARRCKRAHVLAFELDRFQARTCSALARVNGVSDRVHASGLCTVPRLAEINSAARMTVICDCEGAEFSLLDPEQVGWLREASLIVEVHEGTEAGTVDVLRGRLEQTHDIATVRTEPRYPSEYPALNATPGLTDLDKALLLVEPRGSPMTWLTADPR